MMHLLWYTHPHRTLQALTRWLSPAAMPALLDALSLSRSRRSAGALASADITDAPDVTTEATHPFTALGIQLDMIADIHYHHEAWPPVIRRQHRTIETRRVRAKTQLL